MVGLTNKEKDANAERGLRVVSGDVGLVLTLSMVLDLWLPSCLLNLSSYWAHQPLSSVATQPSQRLGMARAKAQAQDLPECQMA